MVPARAQSMSTNTTRPFRISTTAIARRIRRGPMAPSTGRPTALNREGKRIDEALAAIAQLRR